MIAEEFYGRINDADSHELIHPDRLEEHFGSIGAKVRAKLVKRLKTLLEGTEMAQKNFLEEPVEASPVDEASISTIKGFAAPGATDMNRRIQVMDQQGIRRQLLFPGFIGSMARLFATTSADTLRAGGVDVSFVQAKMLPMLAGKLKEAHNTWAVRVQETYSDRLWCTGVVLTNDLRVAQKDLDKLIARGIKGILIPASVPPGGKSPADVAADEFWATCAKNNVAVFLHVGGDEDFLASTVWGKVPQLQPMPSDSAELPLDPYTLSTAHLAAQNFLSAMILGGVFERHPMLRFGIIELGAHWLGPLAESLDMWANVFARRMSATRSMKPSEQIARNVRCTPFHWENVDELVALHGLEDVYCYATDYPHPEGGKSPFESHYTRIQDQRLREKFFVSNAELLFPEPAA